MKEFDLQKAKEGRPVCTRDGRKARIICFDRKDSKGYNIVACITDKNGEEETETYTDQGIVLNGVISKEDLFMASEKKEGWINLYHNIGQDTQPGMHIYTSRKEAEQKKDKNYVTTTKIKWEE